MSEAKERVKQVFTDVQIVDFDDNELLESMLTTSRNKLEIDFVGKSPKIVNESDPIVFLISIRKLDTTNFDFTVGDLIGPVGTPSSIAYISVSGWHYTWVFYDGNNLTFAIDKVQYDLCSPLRMNSQVTGIEIEANLRKPDPQAIQSWRGFASCYGVR